MSRRETGRWLGLLLGLVLVSGPLSAAAQDVCQGREGCLPGDPTAAGRDAEGRRLRMLRASLPSPLDEVGGQVCTAGLDEYWLQRGAEAPVLFGRVCANVGISEGIAVTIGDNRVSTDFAGPGGMRQQFYETTWQLSPPRLRTVQECDATLGDHPRFAQTAVQAETLQGEALADIGPPRRETHDLGCYPRQARQRWIVIPRLPLDAEALRSAGAGLGGCAARLGPAGGGYVLAGRRTRAEVRIVATGPRDLVIQIDDPDLPAAPDARPTWRSSLEIWSTDVFRPVEDAATEGRVNVGRIDIDTGAWTPTSGSAASGPAVTTWRAPMSAGRTVRLFRLQFAPGDYGDLPVNVSVVYAQVRRGVAVMRLGSSRPRAGQASSVGETFDVSPFARCAVRDGALEMVDPGAFALPFEANEAGGLRILR